MYLQVKYLPEGVTGSEAAGEMKDTTPGEDRRKEGMYGKLFVNVKSARNVADEDGWGKGVSDPFTRVILPDAQKKDTKFIKDNLNPTWNELLIFDVKIDRNVSALALP